MGDGQFVNILLINHYAGSLDMGMEFRPYYFAREWVRMGHRVHIAAADYSHLRIHNPVISRDFQREIIDGIIYHWVKAGSYEGNGVKRAVSMFRFVEKLWMHAEQIARCWKPDVVITSSTYHLDTWAGQRIAGICGAKLIHEVHDMWPATLTELGRMSRRHPFVMAVQAAENSAYRNSDKIVSLLPFAEKYMIRHGMAAGKFVYLPNGIALEDWERIQSLPREHQLALEQLKKNGNFIAGYFGGHAQSNALDTLLEAAKELRDSKIRFVMAGDGVEKQRLIKRAQNEKLENVMFLPSVSKQAVPALLSYFDCCLVCGSDSSLYRFGISPNKLYDSMMAAKPVICAVHTKDFVLGRYQCGWMVKPQDGRILAQAVKKMYQLPEVQRDRMGKNGKQAVLEHFTYGILAQKFEQIFHTEG